MGRYTATKGVVDELRQIHERVQLLMENLMLLRDYVEVERLLRHVDLHLAKLIHDTEIVH